MNSKTLGINYYGFFKGVFGISEATRLNALALEKNNISISYKNYTYNGFKRDEIYHEFNDNKHDFDINLFHINIDIVNEFFVNNTEINLSDKYNILYWAWEFPEIPEDAIKILDYFDELWVPSDFCVNIFAQKIKIPVLKFAHPIVKMEQSETFSKSEYNIPENKTCFLTIFDSSSTFERKNPIDTINAFFQNPNETKEAVLIIKTHNLEKNKHVKIAIENTIKGHSNVVVINEKLSKEKLHSLIQQVDILISLHASEGFGLTMAEAMSYGKIVIGTGYSGNLEFMNINTSFLVKYNMSCIQEDSGFIKKGYTISKPNLSHFSEVLKYVLQNRNNLDEIKINAAKFIQTYLSIENIGSLMRSRLKKITLLTTERKSNANLNSTDAFYYENEIIRLNNKIRYLEKSLYNKIRKGVNKLLKKLKGN